MAAAAGEPADRRLASSGAGPTSRAAVELAGAAVVYSSLTGGVRIAVA